MFVVIKIQNGSESIIKTHVGDIETLEKWIDTFFQMEIESWTMCPDIKDTKTICYKIVKKDDTYDLVKQYKKIYTGYIYNTSEKINENICTLRVLECDKAVFTEEYENTSSKPDFWFKYNTDINSSVLKQLDRESMYNIIVHMMQLTEQKPKRVYEEFLDTLTSSLRTIKRDLYNTTVKRIKRMGRDASKPKSE